MTSPTQISFARRHLLTCADLTAGEIDALLVNFRCASRWHSQRTSDDRQVELRGGVLRAELVDQRAASIDQEQQRTQFAKPQRLTLTDAHLYGGRKDSPDPNISDPGRLHQPRAILQQIRGKNVAAAESIYQGLDFGIRQTDVAAH